MKKRKLSKSAKKALKLIEKHRVFPFNTTPATRHAELIAEALCHGKRYAMLEEEPDHCGESILWTIALYYQATSAAARAKALGGENTTSKLHG